MVKRKSLSYLINCCFISILGLSDQSALNLYAQDFDIRGQASGWIVTNPDAATQLGLRYIPNVFIEKTIGNYVLDSEISLDIYGILQYAHKADTTSTSHKFDAYRLWLRFAAKQYEVRIGLQKMDFGSAMLLRALMWFDSIDPRDPLQITDGVYGVLGRYYFLNNANIWIWALYGNNLSRGWELFRSDKNKPEIGGRVELPLFTGSVALSYHHRNIDISSFPMSRFLNPQSSIPENRIALDGKWDIEIGLWFEAVLIKRDLAYSGFNYQRQTNIGIDYTIDLGNAPYIIAEHFTYNLSDQWLGNGEGTSVTALSLNYPLGLIDEITGIFYYEWENNGFYRFLRWQRTYDDWSFYLMGFWNPEQYLLYQISTQNNIFTGKGIQLMVVFNH